MAAKNSKNKKANSKLVVSAGCIVFRRKDNIEYLVMKHTSAGHWGIPKGRLEAGETEFQAALRETQEEAGMSEDKLKVWDGFQSVLHYEAFGKPKKVVLWLSQLVDSNFSVNLSSEHSDFKWLPLEEACQLLDFEDVKKALKDAHNFLNTCK